MFSYITSLFGSNTQPNTYEALIQGKKAYLEYINTAKQMVSELVSYYKDTVNSYINNSIDISLEQSLGNTLTKIIAPKIKEYANNIMLKTASYLDSCVDSYIQNLEADVEISEDYFNNSKGLEFNFITQEIKDIDIEGIGIAGADSDFNLPRL